MPNVLRIPQRKCHGHAIQARSKVGRRGEAAQRLFGQFAVGLIEVVTIALAVIKVLLTEYPVII